MDRHGETQLIKSVIIIESTCMYQCASICKHGCYHVGYLQKINGRDIQNFPLIVNVPAMISVVKYINFSIRFFNISDRQTFAF